MIHKDYETFSEVDLLEVGVFRYAQDPSTEVLVMKFAIDDGPILSWVPHIDGHAPPPALLQALEDGHDVMAHNAEFERTIWRYVLVRKYGWPPPPPDKRWHCTAARAAAVGYPRGLDAAVARAGLGEAYAKDKRGKELIKLFCQPRKPTKTDARTRVLPEDNPDAFEELCEYCEQDVVAERGLDEHLPQLHPFERMVFLLDAHINAVGMPLDMDLLQQSEHVVAALEEDITYRTQVITSPTGDPDDGLRPTQREKLLAWLQSKGCLLPDLTMESVADVVRPNANVYISDEVREVLELRIEASRASTKKLQAMRTCVDLDEGRVKGAYVYGGAHTLRWTSHLVQLHNFVRGLDDPEEIAAVLDAFRTGDPAFVRALYDNPMFMLSKCVRGFIRAGAGNMLEIVDFSQVEARNVDWHAGNEPGLVEWRSGIEKYKLMATKIFGITLEEVDSEARRIGKAAVLGCGFGMSAPRFLEYAQKNGSPNMTPELAELAVGVYRETNAPVVRLWRDVELYAKTAIANPGKEYKLRFCTFRMVRHWLTIQLPSGRSIWYPYARLARGARKFGRDTEQIVFQGAHHPESTYGAKVVENIVQATCRDLLANGLAAVARASKGTGRRVVGHTHDEGIFEAPTALASAPHVEQLMCQVPAWAPGMPLEAKGFVSPFYRKD